MDIKEYIESGIVESYVLGLSTPDENLELENLSAQYPDVKQAVADFELLFEKSVDENLLQPPVSVRTNLLNTLDFAVAEPAKNIQAPVHTLPVRKTNYSNYVAAAAVVLLIVSTSLNFYFYSNIKNTTDRYQALLLERNTLQANNASYKTKLDEMNQSFDLMQSPFVKSIKLNSVKGDKDDIATVYWNSQTKEVYLFSNKMDKIPKGKQYQLWALVDGKPVDAGVVAYDCNGLCKMKVTDRADAFAVTVEKEGGSSAPTLSSMYILGKVS